MVYQRNMENSNYTNYSDNYQDELHEFYFDSS